MTHAADATGFGGRAVVLFESRRAAEMASLVARHGGSPVPAPALRVVERAEDPDARAFAAELAHGEVDALVLMTGTGARTLLDVVDAELGPERDAALARAVIVARGPKPQAVLRDRGVGSFHRVPEPSTWREVVEVLRREGLSARGRRVAVQEHGSPSTALYDALASEGATVRPIRVYAWALPEDTGPLRAALHAIAERRASIALFTSASQVEHALRVAAEESIEDAVKQALREGCVGSIGPVCSEALAAEGIAPDVEPAHPKMGHLVKEAAERAAAVLERKRRA